MGPVWMDTYAPPASRSCWLTWGLLAAPVGVFIGFGMTSLCIHMGLTWTFAFRFMGLWNLTIALIIFTVSRKMYNIDEAMEDKRAFIEEKKRQKVH